MYGYTPDDINKLTIPQFNARRRDIQIILNVEKGIENDMSALDIETRNKKFAASADKFRKLRGF
jgi:hypothetical protein